MPPSTTELLPIQPFCSGANHFLPLFSANMKLPDDPGQAGLWTKAQRELRGMSAEALSQRINGLTLEAGDPTKVSQQVISKWEKGENKRVPAWTRYIVPALEISDGETKEDPHLHNGLDDDSVGVRLLPTWVGLGTGGTGDDDPGIVSFSRDLIERELRSSPEHLLAMVAEGNSMEPQFMGGDQILVDTRRTSLAQPGAFCLWDHDGHVIKYLERIPGSEPAKVRVVSANGLYEPRERLLDEINLIGRVVWFGRRVQ